MMTRFNYTVFAQDLSTLLGRVITVDEARAVKRDLQRHQTIMEIRCNENRDCAGRLAGVERRLSEFFGPRLREFSGDPRGATVKLNPYRVPLAYFSSDWGGNLVFTRYNR